MVCPRCELPASLHPQHWTDTAHKRSIQLQQTVTLKWFKMLHKENVIINNCSTSSSAASRGLLSCPVITNSTVTCFFSVLREDVERREKMGKALAMAQEDANTSERSHTIWRQKKHTSATWLHKLSLHWMTHIEVSNVSQRGGHRRTVSLETALFSS